MAERSHKAVIGEALQRFCHGSDTPTELAFLKSLGSTSSLPFERDKSLQDGCVRNGLGVGLEKNVDVSVCDITITVTNSNADITSQEKDSSRGKEEQWRSDSDSQESCRNDENDSCEVDLGCGELSQTPWTSSRACSPHSNSAESPWDSSGPGRGSSPDSNVPAAPSPGKPAQSSVGSNASQSVENLSACLLNVDLNYLCEDSMLVEKFVNYVFTRRHGRADKQSDDGNVSDMLPDPEVVANLNRLLDTVIKR